MTKHEMDLKEAEEFVRKALSRFPKKEATEKSIKVAAHKVRKVMEQALRR